MTNPLAIFQKLLRELFQFDCADLDFGIYRIVNRKREVIERFITNDLPKAVAEQLDSGALADQAQAAAELEEVTQQISSTLARDAIDADGNLVKFQGTDIGKKYLALKAKAGGGQGRDALEAAIFNHLYAFFSRYYQDGDFISKRRYSKRQRYAIPYNGEEVHLHWANSDQYYIKTGEHFRDYSFAVRDITVHFKLQAADVEQDNVKGDTRFFLPCAEAPDWDEEAKRLDIPFEYRPLTEQEGITYGKKNQQETIITKAVAEIPKQLDKAPDVLAALTGEKRRNDDGQAVSFLEHHLRQYTRRNTSDFFIHKDLKGFLVRELDFYLKNEVLNLGDMEVAGEDRAAGWFQMMRTIRSVGGQIIDFLDQIEGFQKMLWEKRKFVTETQYCIAIGRIDEGFYEDIAGCEAQWDEWKALFSIDEDPIDLFNAGKDKIGKRVAFLKAHSTLSDDVTLGTIPRSEEQLSQYPEEDEKGKFQWRNFIRSGGANDFRSARPRLHYPLIITGDRVRLPDIEWNSLTKKWELIETLLKNDQVVWPISNDGTEYTWRLGIESLEERIGDLRVRRMNDGRTAIESKFRLDEEGVLPKTIWDEKHVNATAYGTTLLRNIMGERQAFSFPKSVYAIEKSLRVCCNDINGTILDYFAGSGTTGHAVINLNREDGGQRKFILVEMGEYFDTVLLPRIKKVAFTPEWKDGNPKRMATPEEAERGPRIVKYMRLESYEDALNNIDFDEDSAQQALQFDDYLLKYMLQWETKRSATLLNVEKLSQPFRYTLHIHADGQTRQQIADIPETFNYLLGLCVETRRVYYDDDRRYVVYRGQIDQQRIAVIWRETQGWDEAALVRDKEFLAEQQLTDGADAVYVNGDSFIREAKALEPVFKRRMFAETQA